MTEITTDSSKSIGFEYDKNLIGDTSKDSQFADENNKVDIWPEGLIRINHARWMNSDLGFNDPERLVQLEIFNGINVENHTIQYFTPTELKEQKEAIKNAPMMKTFCESHFYDVAIIDRETARYLNALDSTQEAWLAFRKSFNAEEQRKFEEWKNSKESDETYPKNTNFTEPERKSVWEVMSGATTEDLFKFKLDIFEQQVVQDSENRELRSKIRKAKSICEVCAAYQELLDLEVVAETGNEE